MSKGLKLYLYQNNSLFKKIALAANHSHNVIIGTGKNATVKLNNKLISSQHAQFIFDNKGHLHIQDLKSTNGTFLNGEKIFVVDVSYKEDKNTNTPDQWTYFINAKSYLIVAAKVFHSPTVSFIENINFNKETPFVFNAERESVFLNKDGSRDYLRASYLYSNYKVVLKK